MAEMVTDAEAQRMREDAGASAFALHGRVQRLLADRERLLDFVFEGANEIAIEIDWHEWRGRARAILREAGRLS